MRKTLLTLLPIFILLTFSCKKEDDVNASTNQSTLNFKNLKGSFSATKIYSYRDPLSHGAFKPFPTAIFGSYAMAQFYDSVPVYVPLNQPKFLDAGIVKVNGQEMDSTFSSLQGYQLLDSFNPNHFQTNVTWEVSGKNSIPATIETISVGFPYISGMSDDTIFRNSPYTITLDTLLNCDSISFTLSISGIAQSKTLPGNTKSFTFQPSAWSVISGSLESFWPISVIAFRYETRISSGRNYIYTNATHVEKIVWFK